MALVPSPASRKFMETTSSRYHDQLQQSAAALEWLTGPERCLTEEMILRFRLGFVADPSPGHEHVRGHIAIPYMTPDGSVVSIRFRRLGGGDGAKYLSMAGDPPRLFNTPALERGTRNIVVCEGEFDAIVAEMCGLPAVGIPGANAWQTVWRRLFVQFDTVFMLHDDDEAGRELVAKIVNSGLDNVRPVPMDGGDVTSFYAQHGRDALRAKVGA